jgi:hypothetical protein
MIPCWGLRRCAQTAGAYWIVRGMCCAASMHPDAVTGARSVLATRVIDVYAVADAILVAHFRVADPYDTILADHYADRSINEVVLVPRVAAPWHTRRMCLFRTMWT